MGLRQYRETKNRAQTLTDFVVDAALCLTVFNLLESVGVSEATTIDELRTCVAVAVVVPHRVIACAWSVNLGQVTNVLASGFNASVLALGFRVEAVGVSTASAIPEATATTVFGVEEVFDGVVVTAGSHVAFKAASLLWRVWDLVSAFLEVLALGFGESIWAASELAGCTTASFGVRSLGRCEVVGTALELAVRAVAALVVRSSGDGDSVAAASELE